MPVSIDDLAGRTGHRQVPTEQVDPFAEDVTEPDEPILQNSDDPNDVVPFRYSITSYGADYPIDALVKRINDGDVFIPSFQRAYVWDSRRASKFVESLLLGLPVPGIFLSREAETDKLLVIDGQQRLRTLQYFYRGYFDSEEQPFALAGVQTLLEGMTYAKLAPPDRRRLDDSILHATVVRQDVPSDDNSSVYHIFARLNTGGLQLTAQEIRACLYHGPFNELLRELNGDLAWRSVFGAENKRLRDQELILRFFAFYYTSDAYGKEPNGTSLRGFLNEYMARNRRLRLQGEPELRRAFLPTINLIWEAVSTDAFRRKRTLNAAVFDAVMVGLARRLEKGEIAKPAGVASAYRSLVDDGDFIEATETGTNAEPSVQLRLNKATAAFAAVR
jgi:hypothetical protein